MKLLNDLMVGSYDGSYEDIVDVIIDYLKQLDAKIVIQANQKKQNIIAIWGAPKLLINCHMDTLPPAGTWHYPPYKLTIKGNKAYGLGAADTKGNIYAVLKAAANIKPKDLMLLFSYDEENGKLESGVTEFLKSCYAKGIKHAIACEPTSLKFVSQHKGYYSYIIKLNSVPAHSSQKADNAITKAAKLIIKLDKLDFNIGKIKGGTQGNMVAGSCEFKASIRTYESPAKVLKKIKSLTKAQVVSYFTGLPLNSSFPIKPLSKADFWTEAALFQQAGIKSITFGAGNIKQAHSPDEFVSLQELEQAQKIFEGIMLK